MNKIITKYKSDLEHAINLIDIQNAYEKECLRVYNRLKIEYPKDYAHRIVVKQI